MNDEEIKRIVKITLNERKNIEREHQELLNDYIELSRDNDKQEYNWNKLKEYLEQEINDSKLEDDFEQAFHMAIVLQEMEEIEGDK